MVTVGDLDGHLVADGAAGLDDRGDPGVRGDLDPVREREVRVGRHHGELRAGAGPAERDVHRRVAARLRRADPHRRAVAREDDRVRPDVAHGPPREQEVGELAQRRVAAGHDLELAAVDVERVDRLDEEAAADALEVEVRDAVVAHAVRRRGRDVEELEPLLVAQDLERGLR